MASKLQNKITEIENMNLEKGETFLYGHCDTQGEINAGMCCEEADLEAIEGTLQYLMMNVAKAIYDSDPELTKADIANLLFTETFGSLNLFINEIEREKDDDEIRAEAAELLTDAFEEFDFYDDFE